MYTPGGHTLLPDAPQSALDYARAFPLENEPRQPLFSNRIEFIAGRDVRLYDINDPKPHEAILGDDAAE